MGVQPFVQDTNKNFDNRDGVTQTFDRKDAPGTAQVVTTGIEPEPTLFSAKLTANRSA